MQLSILIILCCCSRSSFALSGNAQQHQNQPQPQPQNQHQHQHQNQHQSQHQHQPQHQHQHQHQHQPQSSKNPVRVLVTGAAGKTGRVVLSKLEEDHRYEPKGLFRTERSARMVIKDVEHTKCPLEHVVIADVTSPTFLEDLDQNKNANCNCNKNSSNGLENMDAMIICTSAVPRIQKRSLAAMLVKAPWRAMRGKPLMNIRSMRFSWKHGGYPEKVDFHGQKAQIDLAKRLGIPHVVLVSSMGGTNPDNFLNSVGKQHQHQHQHQEVARTSSSKRKEGHGDILLWKREAEKYLVESGLDYTILHPGGLVDTPGGQDDFVFGVNDQLYELNHHHITSTTNTNTNTTNQQPASITRISREDIAELCVAALSAGKGKKVSFDCITIPSTAISSLMTNANASSSFFACPGIGMPAAPEKETIKPKLNLKSATMTRKYSEMTATTTATSMATTTTTTSTSISTTTIPVEATAKGRQKSAEQALCEFFDFSVTTNYDLDEKQ
eukprot:CAMPEP_0168168172 /NCGR_PEP_ID=MMETSP0139_2-20121125/2939_1 /TAXON_ID=44445 /ORGANISM="Pseudo-nitzschia australis, Strain 10249 10 AB" /LENGTH=496 /DNA_ID=CAMNT_0008085459 /DNA_START=233 /DNA_END=1723 /DNA_ORIENTATION=+